MALENVSETIHFVLVMCIIGPGKKECSLSCFVFICSSVLAKLKYRETDKEKWKSGKKNVRRWLYDAIKVLYLLGHW